MLIEKELPIQAYNIDAMGIVSNIDYVRWFEDLRMEYLNQTVPLHEVMKSGIAPVLMHTEVDYLMPLTLFDKPTGRCELTNLGNSSWEMTFEIVTDKGVHCKGRQRGCFYDLHKKKAAKVPEALREAAEGVMAK